MSNIKDDFINEDSHKIVDSIKKHFDKTVKPIKKELSNITEKFNYVYKALVKKKLIEPFAESNSPKRITDKGHALLNKYSVSSYLQDNCELVKDISLKEKTDAQIYMKCLDWVKTQGKEKTAEILLNENIFTEQCEELLALALFEKIKK